MTAKQVAKNLERLSQRFAKAAQEDLAREIQDEMLHQLPAATPGPGNPKAPFATGELQRSWRRGRGARGGLFVGSRAPHAAIIDRGRRRDKHGHMKGSKAAPRGITRPIGRQFGRIARKRSDRTIGKLFR